MRTIQNYLDLVKDQDRTREAVRMLEQATSDPALFSSLTSDFSKLFSLVEELDKDQSNHDLKLAGTYGTLEKLEKTSAIIDEQISHTFLHKHGIDGITFGSMEQVYNPLRSGISSMQETRASLLKQGMSANFADNLAARYLKGIE